jgi:hypothetical protein
LLFFQNKLNFLKIKKCVKLMNLNFNHRPPNRLQNREDNRRVNYYNPNESTVVQIITEAFNTYIENNAIESNTIGISITYVENENDTAIKTIYIIKRAYCTVSSNIRVNNGEYLNNYQEIDNGQVFQNDQLTELIEQIQSFYLVFEISLCEIYNDDPVSRNRNVNGGIRGRRADGLNGYRPFTIPIKVLFINNIPANISVGLRNALIQFRETGAAMFARRVRENPPRNPDDYEEPYILYGESDQNPDQLINNPALAEDEVTERSWPGECRICFDTDFLDGYCRVNCDAGHIFHCSCMNRWRNTRMQNSFYQHGWHNECPLCRQNISEIANVEIPPGMAFGKHRKGNLKLINSEIKYLKNLK